MATTQNNRICRVAVTGPESSGKTSLAKALAGHYNAAWVPEYAREYLEGLDRPYTPADIAKICASQVELEKVQAAKAGKVLFCDTDPLVCKIWCEEKFGYCHPLIEEYFNLNPYDLFLLCSPDLPWEPDPLRENPYDRERLFGLYQSYLVSNGLPFAIIRGSADSRLHMAVDAVDSII